DYDAPETSNDNLTHSSNANNLDEQVVSIEATNYMQFLNVTGVFDFNFTPGEINPLNPDLDPKKDIDILGSTSKRGGVGGAIFLSFLNNTTHAIVEDGVELYSGTKKGLNVKAEEAILTFAFTQAGAKAGQYGFAGSFAYMQQTSDNLALIAAGSEITGGRLDVYAGNLETNINWGGGVAKGKSPGPRAAIAVHNIHRDPQAGI